ncbi:MAG: DHHW family protein [Oscillospiraceae bacterium]
MEPKFERRSRTAERSEKQKKYNDKHSKQRRVLDKVYLAVLTVVFEAAALSLLILPRSTVSESERRELAEFPEFSAESFFSGEFTEGVAKWFSDTVPFRDFLTERSVQLRELTGFRDDGIKLHNVTVPAESETESAPKPSTTSAVEKQESVPVEDNTSAPAATTATSTEAANHEIAEVEQEIPADENVSIKNNGIAVVGTRALMLYGGSYSVGETYADVMNLYKEILGDDVNVWSMIIPTACEFYSPPEVQAYCGSELNNINHVIERLDGVRAVDAYTALAEHTKEDIYLRTDHHWAALGAYYAAQEFAKTAGLPFADISTYEQRVVHDYVGTMYAYSEDIVIKNNPEDFVYYVPTTVNYTTTYYNYILEDGKIVGAETPYEGNFFIKYGDGNGMAYCTYMGGDAKIVNIHSDAGTGRRLIIFKDSYGNALPPFLFGSFDDIWVVDMRYFTHNAIDFIKEKGITDVLFANNAFHAATASTVTYYNKFLTQEDWGY